jgi:hypothetical protein
MDLTFIFLFDLRHDMREEIERCDTSLSMKEMERCCTLVCILKMSQERRSDTSSCDRKTRSIGVVSNRVDKGTDRNNICILVKITDAPNRYIMDLHHYSFHESVVHQM